MARLLEEYVLEGNCFERALLLQVLATAQLPDFVVDARHEGTRRSLVARASVGLVLRVEGLFIKTEVNLGEKVLMEQIICLLRERSSEEFDTLRIAELKGEFMLGCLACDAVVRDRM